MASGRNKKKKAKKNIAKRKPQPVKPTAPPPTAPPVNLPFPPDGPVDEMERNATTEQPSQAEEAGGADDEESS